MVKPKLFSNFSTFFTFILGANSYYPSEKKAENGKWKPSNLSETGGFQILGAFKLDHLQHVKAILLPYSIFSPFSLSCWRANSYYPRERKAEKGKREFTQNG